MEIDKLEVAKLELKDGDILAVIIRDRYMTQAEIVRTRESLNEILAPIGVKGMIFNADVDFSVIRKTQEEYTDPTLCH